MMRVRYRKGRIYTFNDNVHRTNVLKFFFDIFILNRKLNMIKLKDILSEAYAWERQEGKSLPTLAEVQAAYDARMREDAHNEDPDEKDHVYEPEPSIDDEDDEDDDDDRYMYEAEDKADKDYDGDGEVESGSEEYLGSRDKAIKAAADSTPDGNNISKRRAKAQLKNDKDDSHIYGHDAFGTVTKLNSPSDVDKVDSNGKPEYKNFTIKTESLAKAFNKRMLGNLHGHEYILREAFKRK
jgi:hypothetical protein